MDKKPSTIACLCCGERGMSEPWAKSTDLEYRTTDEEFQYLRCKNCGSIFIHPIPIEKLGQIYPSNYYSYAQSQDSIVHRVKKWLDSRHFKKLLKSIESQQLHALDVGGGAGWELNLVKAADNRVSFTQVVDLDPNAEQEAKANGHDYFCGRFEDFDSPKKFDLILMLNLIEHVNNPLGVLEKARSLLSTNGLILIKTPNIDSWDARIFRHYDWAGYHCPRHWVLFTKQSLFELVRCANLKTIEAKYTQGAPFWAASVMFLLEKKGLISITKERPVVYHPLFGLLSAFFAGFDFIRGMIANTSQMFFIVGK